MSAKAPQLPPPGKKPKPKKRYAREPDQVPDRSPKPPPPKAEELRPQQGPQEMFLSSPADIVFYGGAAGGGKTLALVLEAARNVHVPGYAAIMFRRQSTEITGGGSMWEEATRIYPAIGGESREGRLDWSFKTGGARSIIEFDHLQYEKDKENHQGKQYAFIGFDELTHFTASQFWYLLSRNRSTCGVVPYVRATCNPDPDSFVRGIIAWWLDKDGFAIPERRGVIRWMVREGDDLHWADTAEELKAKFPGLVPLSFTFISAKLDDNPILEKKDPGYRSKLMMLQRVDRERLLGANWNIRVTAGSFFKRHWFKLIDAPPSPADVLYMGRAWDKAATEPNVENEDPDWTSGTKVARTRDGMIVICHNVRERLGPHGVEELILDTAEHDGHLCNVLMWQDPAQAGKSEIEHFARLLTIGDPVRRRPGGFVFDSERANKDKIAYAKPVSSAAEHGLVLVVRGHWNEKFFDALEGFPDPARHDDDVDSLSLGFLKAATNDLAWLEGMVK